MHRTRRLSVLALILLLGAALWLPGCDNPACVFGGNCFGGGVSGALGTGTASVPGDGEWVSVSAPTVERVAPTGSASVDSRTPLVVVFSESMASSGMQTLFLLHDSSGLPVAVVASLIGDGRVLVLLPVNELDAGATYSLDYNQNGSVEDRTGQVLAIPTDTQLTTITVLATNATFPKLVTTWPSGNAINQGGKGEVLAFFDRPLDELTLDSSSFHVQVDGADLVPPVEPTILTLAGGAATDARVVRWRNVDAGGAPLALGLNATVTVELSPTGHVIEDAGGFALAHTSFTYHTAPFGSPVSASITSEPSDAIGIDAISGPQNLAVQVVLEGAQSGDRIGVYLFGTEPDVPQDPRMICLSRDVPISAPYTDFTLTAAEIDLLATSSPLKARFEDGTVHMCFELRRGTAVSPVMQLDVDPAQSGKQAPVLDTTPPTLLGLGTSGTDTLDYRSDMRDLVVIGRASEQLRAATVSCALGDNMGGATAPPPVVGSASGGLFVARPVGVGLLDPAQLPLPFELTIYDRALNHAGPFPSSMQQVGACGPGNPSYSEIAVRVLDAVTRAPIAGASVHTHEYDPLSDGVYSVADFPTDQNGFVLMPASLVGAKNILTVDAPGYELFTFEGVTVDRLDVPLHALLDAGATVEGSVSSSAPQIALYTGLVADSRLDDPGQVFEPVSSCSFDPTSQLFACPYDPYPVVSRVVGAQSAFAIFAPPSILLYSAAAFLKAATFEIPVAPAAPGAAVVNDQSHRHLLDEPGLDPEEAAIDAPPQLLTTTNYPGLVGSPVVSIETRAPGIPGTVVVGAGQAFTDGLPAGTFAVRAAYPGSVDGIQDTPDDQLGEYVLQGTLEPDLMLRMQVHDSAGNIGGVRPRFSTSPIAEDPPAAPDLGLFPIELDSLGLAYKLSFTDVLPDSAGQPGLYRVVLKDSAGGRWVIWTTDPPDANGPEVAVHLPLVGTGLSFPLAPGDLDCKISLFAWPTLDTAAFLWSDVEREFDLFSHSTLLIVTPP